MIIVVRTVYVRSSYVIVPCIVGITIRVLVCIFWLDDGNLSELYNYKSLEIIAKLLVVLAAFGYMFSNIIAYEKLKNMDSFTITTFATFFGAIFSIPFLLFGIFNSNLDFNFSRSSLYAIVYLGIFPTAIAFQFRYYITKTSGPVFLSYVAYLIPCFAVIWGYILLSEKIGINAFIGIILILAGVYLGQSNLMSKISKKYV